MDQLAPVEPSTERSAAGCPQESRHPATLSASAERTPRTTQGGSAGEAHLTPGSVARLAAHAGGVRSETRSAA